MNKLTTVGNRIPATTPEAIDKIRQAEAAAMQLPQVPVETAHCIHAGIYSRTIKIPAGVIITGALIKRSTQLIVCGHAIVFVGDDTFNVCGYHLFAASAGRKQAFFAHADTWLTMCFSTNALTVEEAEAEFTDETDILASRNPDNKNNIIITGE